MKLNQNMGKYERGLWYEYIDSLFIPSNNSDLEKRFKSDCVMPSFSQFKDRLCWCEQIRKSNIYEDVIEVRCRYCGKWFVPTVKSIQMRIGDVEKRTGGGCFLYCSNQCKNLCPTYKTKSKYKGIKYLNSREVPAELRQMVFKRDGWECQRCFSEKSLECHHIIPIKKAPVLQADIDNCMTLCTKCHKKAHSERGCRYTDLANCV